MVVERAAVESTDKWNVGAIYASLEAWDEEFEHYSKDNYKNLGVEELTALKGKLCETPENLLRGLEIMLNGSNQIEKLYTYAHLRHDEDTADDKCKACYGKASSMSHSVAEAFSWVEPEILACDSDQMQRLLDSPKLAPYKTYIERVFHVKEHTLSPEMEELLAQAGQALSACPKIFSAIDNSDIQFGFVEDSKGEKHELSHAAYGRMIRSQDRVLRANAFKQMHGKYRELENTLCETLSGVVQKHVFIAKARKYSSCLEAALFPNNIDTRVYRSLIDAVHANIGTLHKYVSLRKKLLNVDELHLYDLYVPLLANYEVTIPYNQAVDDTIAATAPLGEEYQKIINDGLRTKGWVDKFENKNKRSGAYSSGCFAVPDMPYILLNYDGTLNDAFTLAHEAGHSMHSYFSRTHQPYQYSDYSIFVAEVASTFNETLMHRHLLSKPDIDPRFKSFLVNQAIEDIRTTILRQTMFAEFELMIHELVEKKEPLTPTLLKQKYHDLNRFYFGPDIVIDEDIDIEWARIPHFYYNFYVYQYATGLSAALYLADRVVNGGEQERDDYLKFLKGGCSLYPIDMLKVAGVDMLTPEPVNKALKRFSDLVDELERLLLPEATKST